MDMCTCKKVLGEWWDCCVKGETVVRKSGYKSEKKEEEKKDPE